MDATDLRLECPSCRTSYTAVRCGLIPQPKQTTIASIACCLCLAPFDVKIEPHPRQGWFARVILRRPAPPTHTITTAPRQ